MAFKIAKADDEQRLVFGWASVAADRGGTQIVDQQDDMVDVDELERAAYDHVLHFRSVGERHDADLRHKGRLVESVVFTKQKLDAMGIGAGAVPYGWWVGYKIDDKSAWQKIKSGEYAMFSIEGQAAREPVAKTFRQIIRKFNPYHGSDGRFTSGSASVSFSASAAMIATNTKVQAMMQYFVDRKSNLQTQVGVAQTKAQFVKNGRFEAWGALDYSAPLTEKQVEDYELRAATDNPDLYRYPPRQLDAQLQVVGKWEVERNISETKRLAEWQPDTGNFRLKNSSERWPVNVRFRKIIAERERPSIAGQLEKGAKQAAKDNAARPAPEKKTDKDR